MHIKYLFLILITTPLFSFQSNSDPCPCCSSAYEEFSFWIGKWDVKDSSGEHLGYNTIQFLEDSCILSEHWQGNGGSGRSYSYFNKKDSSWNQLWIDNTGGVLQLKGGLLDGAMVMRSELIPGKKVDFYYNQISWIPNANGTVTQKWEVFQKDGTLLQVVFLGFYHPIKE